MNTIESILSQLTSDALVSDLKTVLREQDPEFPPVESAFQEATRALASTIGKEEAEKLLKAAGIDEKALSAEELEAVQLTLAEPSAQPEEESPEQQTPKAVNFPQ